MTMTHDEIVAAFDRMRADLIEALGVRIDALPDQSPLKRRVVVKMAKNIEHGELIDFPNFGEHRVNGWGHNGKRVVVSSGPYLASFDPDERVRVVREVPV